MKVELQNKINLLSAFTFVLIFVVAVSFLYSKNSTKSCTQLSERECIASLSCEPEYTGPSCPMCLDIGTYKGCRQSEEKMVRKTTCENTGGSWSSEEVHHCQCPETAGKYSRGSAGNLGCLTNEELCKETGGVFESSCSCPTGYYWEWTFGCYEAQ